MLHSRSTKTWLSRYIPQGVHEDFLFGRHLSHRIFDKAKNTCPDTTTREGREEHRRKTIMDVVIRANYSSTSTAVAVCDGLTQNGWDIDTLQSLEPDELQAETNLPPGTAFRLFQILQQDAFQEVSRWKDNEALKNNTHQSEDTSTPTSRIDAAAMLSTQDIQQLLDTQAASSASQIEHPKS